MGAWLAVGDNPIWIVTTRWFAKKTKGEEKNRRKEKKKKNISPGTH